MINEFVLVTWFLKFTKKILVTIIRVTSKSIYIKRTSKNYNVPEVTLI